jgi:Na+-driven multidrug efflux pump
VDRVAIVGIGYNFVLTGTLVTLLIAFGPTALALFLPDAGTIAIAQHINLIVTWSFVLFGVSFVLAGVMRSTGAVVPPLLILFFAIWIARIPFAYYFAESLKADAIWWSFPVGSVASLVLSALYYRFGGWKKARMLAPIPAAPLPPPAEA